MITCAFDTETHLFRPGVMAPELVCVSYVFDDREPDLVHVKDPLCKMLVEAWLTRDDVLLVGHHVPYDLAVLCAQWPDLTHLVFAALDADRVTCTKIRSQLLDIAAGQFRGHFQEYQKTKVDIDGVETLVRGARWVKHSYDLDALIYRTAGRRLDKDTWRLRYGEFVNTPVNQWPPDAQLYPKEDARATMEVFRSQEVHAVPYLEDQYRQVRAAWALHLTSVWGLRTHKPGVDKLETETVAALAAIENGLKENGLVRHDGSRNTKLAQARMVSVCAREGITLRLTDGGAPSLDSDACEASGDDLLEDYAELTSLKAVINKDLVVLRAGTEFPVHTSFGLAASGRVTSAKPNVQNPRRLPGIREAFVPRAGKVFAQADFSALELHTLAQVCLTLFGKSALGSVLNTGSDPHTDFAASLLAISYEEALTRKKVGDESLDNARQTAKVANFGFPGGLGAEKLCLFARKTYGVRITQDQARVLKEAWQERWPEMRAFFSHVGALIDEDTGIGQLTQIFSNRTRGGCHYTGLANSFFQGLGADAAKRATYLVSRACYAEPTNVLYGSRIVNQVHDELIVETDDTPAAHDVAIELGRLMVEGANEFLPDVPARVEPLLSRCWSKKAKPVFVEGRLVPWSP